MIKVHVFHTGKVRVDRAIPYREANPLAVTGLFRSADKKLELPVSCYLIEHPKGRILIDSGWHSRYVTQRPKRFFGMLDHISGPILREGESIDCQLAALGLAPTDLDGVYLSHLDFDHTSGLALLKGAHGFFASEEEIADAKAHPLRYVASTWAGAPITPFRYDNTGIGPVGKSYDVFGDGSVVLVNTPGHSHGHFSVLVRGAARYVLLAGDAVYTQRSIREHILPGFTVDVALAQKSLDWVCQCAADPDCVLTAPNHDPAIAPQVVEL